MNIIEKSYNFKSNMDKRKSTTRIILHHAAASSCSADDVHRWHLNNGWAGIGYHFFVRKDGSIYRGRPLGYVGAHASGSNYDSVGVCFEGDFTKESMPDVQKEAGKEIVAYLKNYYGIKKVQRHSDVCATACPGGNFPFTEIANATVASVANSVADADEVVTVSLHMLGEGDSSAAVGNLQILLQAKGYSLGKYGVDSDFGTCTGDAVEQFQNNNGLDADRIVGKDTWTALLNK